MTDSWKHCQRHNGPRILTTYLWFISKVDVKTSCRDYLRYRVNTLGPLQSVTFVWILTLVNIPIYLYQENDTNEYPNIFVWIFSTRTNIWIYSYQNLDTNEYPNKYLDQKYSNTQIFEYIRHTLVHDHDEHGIINRGKYKMLCRWWKSTSSSAVPYIDVVMLMLWWRWKLKNPPPPVRCHTFWPSLGWSRPSRRTCAARRLGLGMLEGSPLETLPPTSRKQLGRIPAYTLMGSTIC